MTKLCDPLQAAFSEPIWGNGATPQSRSSISLKAFICQMPFQWKGVLAVLEGDVLGVLGNVLGAVPVLDEANHPLQRLDAGVGVEGGFRDVLVVQVAAELPQERLPLQDARERKRRHPRTLYAGAFQILERGLILLARLGRFVGIEAGFLHERLVVVEAQGVRVQGYAVAAAVVDAGVPDQGCEVALLEAQRVRYVVERDDHGPRRVGAELVAVHDPEVRTLAASDRLRDRLVVVDPLHGVHLDLDVFMLGGELLHELAHIWSIATREPVPELEFHLRTIVALAPATPGALHRGVVLRPTAATSQRKPRTSSKARPEKLAPRQTAAHSTRAQTHLPSFPPTPTPSAPKCNLSRLAGF